MIFHHVWIGMPRIWLFLALVQAEIGFRYRHGDRNDQWIGSEMAGLAAVNQSGAAKVIDGGAVRVYVDLPQLDIKFLHAPGKGLQIARGQTWELFLYVFAELILGVFFRLIDFAAIGDKFRLPGHDRR